MLHTEQFWGWLGHVLLRPIEAPPESNRDMWEAIAVAFEAVNSSWEDCLMFLPPPPIPSPKLEKVKLRKFPAPEYLRWKPRERRPP